MMTMSYDTFSTPLGAEVRDVHVAGRLGLIQAAHRHLHRSGLHGLGLARGMVEDVV